jgi:hypothetical protein
MPHVAANRGIIPGFIVSATTIFGPRNNNARIVTNTRRADDNNQST